MKNLIPMLVLGAFILPLGAVAQDHSDTKMDKKGSAIKQYEVSAEFQKQLNAIYKVSLEMNNLFVADDADGAQEMAGKMTHKVTEVDMSLIKGEAHMAWMSYMKVLSDELGKIMVSNDIVKQRRSYALVSEELYKVVKSFGVGETVYYMFCPMAKSNWLSNSKEINNPYYGSIMLKCGSTKEVLN